MKHKKKLILFQPKQYNELFSTYHNSKKNLNLHSKINLPKISTNLPKEWESQASTSRTNISTSNNIFHNKNNISYKKTSYIFNINKEFYYPIATQQKGSETSRYSDFLPYPSITQHFKKIVDNKSKEKKKIEKNDTELKMVYLDLVNSENNKNDVKLETCLIENIEKEKIKTNIINDQNADINNKQKLEGILVQTEDSKIKNEISAIDNIPITLINLFAEEIYKNYYNHENSTKGKNIHTENIKQSFNNINRNFYIKNKFFQYVLDNVKHKIEIISQKNESISVLYVKNLINDEIKYLQKKISDYKKQYYTENTSNNISKISNYEIASGNSFKFKTNNNSSIKDNEVSTNNNSSQLGSLILKNIYAKKNEGTKKRKFDKMNIFNSFDPIKFFQNKEIILSINRKDEEKNSKKTKILINSYKSKKNSSDEENYNNSNYNLTSNSVDLAYKRIKSKIFNKNFDKKIPRTFSQVFLKSEYKKASDFIKEISNKIEKNYLFKKRKRKINKSKENLDENKKGIDNYDKRNNYIYEEYNDSYTITPKREKQNIGINTDLGENKIKYKNEKIKNNYEKIIKTINDIKEKENKRNYNTPSKATIKNNVLINQNKKRGNNQTKILFDNNKLMRKYIESNLNNQLDHKIINNIINKNSLLDNEDNIDNINKINNIDNLDKIDNIDNIGKIDNINNIDNIINLNINKKKKKVKEKDIPKNIVISRNLNQNQDLNSIKTSKPSNKKSKEYNKDKNYINSINSNSSNKSNKINKVIGGGKNKKHKNNIMNNKSKKNNNNININNPNEIINKLNIKIDNSEGEKNYSEESSEESKEEDEYDEEEEEEDEKDDNNPNKEGKKRKKKKKNISKRKKTNKHNIINQNKINQIKNEFEEINENSIEKENQKNEINTNYQKNQKLINTKNKQEQPIKKKFFKRHSVFLPMPKNIISIKTEEVTPKRRQIRTKSIKIKTEKTKKKTLNINVGKNSKNINNKKIDIRKKLFNEKENEEEELDEETLNNLKNNNINMDEFYKKNLTKNKKTKRGGKGIPNEKLMKGKNDDLLTLLDENVDDLIEKENNKTKRKKNNILFDKEEEIKILKEVEEMEEGLSLDERKYIISEMLDLRKLLVKSEKKDKETKNKINLKRISIYKMVNKYFITWILKDLSMKIVAPEKYKKKLDKLVRIKSYRIYSDKYLKKLEINYIIPFIEQEEKRKKDEEERKAKLARRKLALEEFERYKRMAEEKKKKELIYDNSYLFKKEKKKQFQLRKEVEEILNTDYGKYYNYKKQNILPEEKTKKFIKKKKAKKQIKKNSIFTREEMTQEDKEEEEQQLRLFKEMEERERKEEIMDKKLREFFERIQKLKNGDFKDFDKELNFLIEEQIDQSKMIQEDKQNRMNSFVKELNFNRVKAKFNIDFKNKQICFISPIIFSYDNKKTNND